MHKSILFLTVVAGLAGCAHKPEGGASESPLGAPAASEAAAGASAASMGSEQTATAQLEPKSGDTKLSGNASFRTTAEGVVVVLHVEGATPGQHGAHIHETGDCSDPEAKNAGGHWNPEGHKHGAPPPGSSHLGDLGNLTIGADGTGHLELSSKEWKIGDGSPQDVIGKAVVIHGGADDLATDPAGNSGPRVGCGVIH